MKKKKKSEPDLFEYRIEYSLNNSLPAKRFFMALNPKNALSQLAYTCIKSTPFSNISQAQCDLFVKAFSNLSTDFMSPPELLGVPEPIPNQESPELDPAPEIVKPQDAPVDNSEDTITSESQEEELQSIQVETKIDSNTEYLEKQNVRLEQIVIIEKKNHVKLKEYENLKSDIDNMLEWFVSNISILLFEEYNRWAEKWYTIEYPIISNQDESTE